MRVTVMGLGLFGGGAGAARFFAERGGEVTGTDLRGVEALAPAVESLCDLDIRYVLGGHDEDDFKKCELVVVNPAVKPGDRFVEIARDAGARVTTELELGLERAARRKARVLAVTGTNGKSTTCAMLASIMKAADPRTRSGGNLGGSLLLAADTIPEGAPLVLEVSSFQLHRLASFPGLEVAVVTNLSPNHLDWHPSVEHYYASKKRLIELLPEGGRAVLNPDFGELARWGAELARQTVWFSSVGEPAGDAVWAEGSSVWARFGGDAVTVASTLEIPMPGLHDIENALAAAAAALAFGVEAAAVSEGLASFEPLGHRLELVAESGGVQFIDDSASTTPESTIGALRSVEGPTALIAGGSDKGCPFDELGGEALRWARGIVVLGPAGKKIASAVRTAAAALVLGPRVEEAQGFDDAFARAVAMVEGGGTVLLSPAAASFDEFRNYTERGMRFGELARAWAAGGLDSGRRSV